MRKLSGTIRLAATWTLLTASVGIAAPPRWTAQSPSDFQAVGTGLRTLPAADPGMPEPLSMPPAEISPYGDLWAGYRPDYPHPPMATCQCGCNAASGCAGHHQGVIHKLFDKMTSRMHRLLNKSRGCDCGGCGAVDEPSCAADCDSACDAMGPATNLPMMQPYSETIRPYIPPSPPADDFSDPFADDVLNQAVPRQEITEAAYYEP